MKTIKIGKKKIKISHIGIVILILAISLFVIGTQVDIHPAVLLPGLKNCPTFAPAPTSCPIGSTLIYPPFDEKLGCTPPAYCSSDIIAPLPTTVVCIKDVQQCPDGSWVGRIAPKCDFGICPIAPVPTVVIKTPVPTAPPCPSFVPAYCPDGTLMPGPIVNGCQTPSTCINKPVTEQPTMSIANIIASIWAWIIGIFGV